MKNEELFRAIGGVEEDKIADAAKALQKKPARRWAGLAAAAASLCLVVVSAAYFSGGFGRDAVGDVTADTEAFGFTMEESNVPYFPISFEERIRYGLVDEGEVGLTKENDYKITKADLGEVMGTVASCGDESLIGCTVYRFASLPKLDSICIVDLGGSYAFYTTDGPSFHWEEGKSSDRIAELYDLPSATKAVVQTGDWETVLTITDQDTIAAIAALLGGKEDIGLAGNEQRYADLWKEVTGNEDVYYDGGSMLYTNGLTPDDTDPIWHEGQRVVTFYFENGYTLELLYCPAISTFQCGGYYPMTEEEVAEMNALLGVA